MEIEEPPASGDLARLMGVQDYPDEGYEIGEITYKDNQASGIETGLAEASVTLNYSGGAVDRIFLLSLVDGSWQIDDIRMP